MSNNKSKVIIIGGGVLGISSAYFLEKMGAEVTLVESNEIGSGCSYANGGLLVPSHSIPLPQPGMVQKGLLSMFSKFPSFSIDPKEFIKALPWLLTFMRYCYSHKLQSNLKYICELASHSKNIYEEIATTEKINFEFKKKGMILLFQKQKSFDKSCKFSEILKQQGIEEQILDSQQVKTLEPTVSKTIGGIFYPNDAHLDPNKYIKSLTQLLKPKIQLLDHTKVIGFDFSSTKISSVKTTKGILKADKIIICAGTFSKELLKTLNKKIPLQAAQGHSLVVEKNRQSPQIPLILEDAKITVTPFVRGTRYSGLLNFCSTSQKINKQKINIIKNAVNYFLHDPVFAKKNTEAWCGYRPCTPDGVPIISQVDSYQNLFLATGHAMLGMTLGPMSGKLIAELALNKVPSMPIGAFSLSRF
jgi:D-amino-acid dehydrogenase